MNTWLLLTIFILAVAAVAMAKNLWEAAQGNIVLNDIEQLTREQFIKKYQHQLGQQAEEVYDLYHPTKPAGS